MKKIISLCLCMVMIFSLAAPVFAVESTASSETVTNGIVFEDSFGNKYILSSTVNGDYVTAIQTTLDGTLVAKTVLNTKSGELTNTVRVEQNENMQLVNSETTSGYCEYKSSLSEYILSESSMLQSGTARASNFDSTFYDSTWVNKGTGRTDYVYQEKILTGENSYRAMGTYTESKRMAFTFVRKTLVTVVATALSQVLSGAGAITGAVLAAYLLKDYGISVAEDVILSSFNPIVSIRSYDVKYRTVMYPNGTRTVMCIINRTIDYVYSDLDGKINREYVDMVSYTTGTRAINGGCSESLAIAASAFEAKYITQTYPDLSLPVSGPSYTWD